MRRGLYMTVPSGASLESCPIDPYLITAKMTPDAVLAYHTALEFYGQAYSVYDEFIYLSKLVGRPFLFQGHKFRAYSFSKNLRDKKQEFFDIKSVDRAGINIRVTSLERTLVDILDRPFLGGGWEEIWRSLESVEFFNLDKVIEYALMLENSTTIAKVGLYLELHKDTLMVTEAHLKQLRGYCPRQPHYMERKGRKRGHFIKEWNLIVPAEVMERVWEESS